MHFYPEIIISLKRKKLTPKEIARLKIKLSQKYKLKKIPSNVEIWLNAESEDLIKLKYLQTKPSRTISGVSPVAVMTKPFRCPHGKCAYCPGGVKSVFGSVPQSYTGKEPATRRAIRNHYNPYLQVFNRLEQYICLGHMPQKVDLIIMGGTFPSVPKKYQKQFVKYCFKAMNDFSKLFFKRNNFDFAKFKKFFELPGDIHSEERIKRIQKKLLKLKNPTCHPPTTLPLIELEKEHKRNEKSHIKCIGLTIETRPDYGKLEQGKFMLELGCTKVELGVQSVYEDALKRVQRGHSVKDSVESIRILKDLGFKLNFHMMPGLPGVDRKRDLQGLKELFKNPDFRPDMLKIYPCMVVRGTKLYNLWRKRKYKPLTTKQAAELIVEFKKSVPKYCRIMRVQRDIPTFMTEAGVDRTNLRQYIAELMNKNKIKCRCIRCREPRGRKLSNKIKILMKYYEASKGMEFFISAEDVKNDILLGFCRLRFPSQSLRKEITNKSALIRELHVYGQMAELGKKGVVQHKGLGKKLLEKAEEIAKTYYKNKMVVISGIGARGYFRKRGYKREGVYMVKNLKN